jgi:Glycosyltransferase family 92
MACLVVAYVFIVISVTHVHYFSSSSSSSQQYHQNTTTTADVVALNAEMQALKQKVIGAQADSIAKSKQEQEQQQDQQQKSLRQHQDEKKKLLLEQQQENQLQQQLQHQIAEAVTNNNKKKERDPLLAQAAWSDPYSGPIRKHHLENQFGHGVDPEHVLGLSDAEEAVVARAAQALNRRHHDVPVDQHPTPDYILSAYLEPSNIDSDWHVVPLPRRETSTAQRALLEKRTYSRLHSCSKLTQQFPTDDADGAPTVDDAFLPWIHDVFPTADGQYIQVVAQNKRRCKTGRKEQDIMMFQQPQAALFQHVPVQRIVVSKHVGNTSTTGKNTTTTRYKLTTHDQADADGMATRYICRFKGPNMQQNEMIETLSEFNFDYDWTNFRKRYRGFLKEDGGIKAIHSSQLIFKCPVPASLQEAIRTGTTVQNDWATIFMDIIPIRTPPRYGQPLQFLQPRYKSFETTNETQRFDPMKAWGDDYIIPLIEDSGRWENIPICLPSLLQYENQTVSDLPTVIPAPPRQVKHRLVSCIWASAGYATRGNRFAINDGQRRLMEWLSHNIAIGFDHFYLYDNSGAFRNDTSLKPVADLFPNHVTYVPWPSQICNNNPNNVDSVGERSSQYAAESSCRLRFGPHVDWIGQFDIDEYLIPMGNYTNALQLLDKLEQEDTRIISLKSWRAWPRWDYIQHPVEKIADKNVCWHTDPCFSLKIPLSTTMLQAYNCDRQPPGQKKDKMPAEKQIYRADYVTHHFVHYAAVTALSEMNETEYVKEGFRWKSRAFPDPRQRFGDENHEALMVHTKAVAVQDTAGWERICHVDHLKLPKDQQETCRLGMPWPEPWPDNPDTAQITGTVEGKAYNCYVNNKVETILVPKLEREMAKRTPFFRDKIYPSS